MAVVIGDDGVIGGDSICGACGAGYQRGGGHNCGETPRERALRDRVTALESALADARREVERVTAERDAIGQGVEDLILVAQKTEDRGGYVTGYRFNTGALHRLLGIVRQSCTGIDQRIDRTRPPCGMLAPFYADSFTPCVAPYGHDGTCDHRPLRDDAIRERDEQRARAEKAERELSDARRCCVGHRQQLEAETARRLRVESERDEARAELAKIKSGGGR